MARLSKLIYVITCDPELDNVGRNPGLLGAETGRLNRILGDFLLAEMRFHAQALQAYTADFRCLPLLSGEDEEDPPCGHTRESSRGHSPGKSREKKVVFSASDETQPPALERGHMRRSESESSDLSLGDLATL